MKFSIKVLCFTVMFAFLNGDLFSQYLDDQGEVLKHKIIEELMEFQDDRVSQIAHANKIAKDLNREINHHPVLQENHDLKIEKLKILSQLMKGLGDFTFLRSVSDLSPWEKQRIMDSISLEALMIEYKIQSLNDSLYALYDRLIDITQRGDRETRATKERAAHLLGKSPFYDHIEYIFENHRSMHFGFVMDRFGDMETDFGVYRSGMMGLISDLDKDDKKLYSWRLMPFLLKYWGDADWAADLHPDFEFLLFSTLTYNYKQTNLLLEFMKSNAKDPDTSVYNGWY